MQEILITDLPTATKLLEAKRSTFWRYEQWKEEVETQAMEQGYLATVRGARRHLEAAARSDNKWDRQKAARQASNFMIQAAGGELAKRAMSQIWKSGVLSRTDTLFVFMVHDEVVLSVNRRDAKEVIRIVHEAVSQPYTPDFPVPFVGSISLGLNFGQQVELGEAFDADLIERTVVDLFENKD
jgi:DNA polymerase I-like protein with 3'-5' exonuclease and polymerase domains